MELDTVPMTASWWAKYMRARDREVLGTRFFPPLPGGKESNNKSRGQDQRECVPCVPTPFPRSASKKGSEQPRLSAEKQPAINVRGGNSDPARASWCTPKWLADAVGAFDLDPFSNLRSHIHAEASCALERGDDGFGDGSPGSFRCGPQGALQHASSYWTVWIQPPYSRGFVARALTHYADTRWVALLRFDPRTAWFDAVYAAASLVCVLRRAPDGSPFGFEPPPGVVASSNSFPHALFYRHEEDVIDAVLAHAIAWRKKPT